MLGGLAVQSGLGFLDRAESSDMVVLAPFLHLHQFGLILLREQIADSLFVFGVRHEEGVALLLFGLWNRRF